MSTQKKDWQAEWRAIQKESRTLAKRANQRLVRLERYSQREGLSGIKEFAYKKAEAYIKATYGESKSGKARFKEHVKLYDVSDGTKLLTGDELLKKNIQIQKYRIKHMKEFLESETSTLGQSRAGKKTKGIKKVYAGRAATISKKFLEKYGLSVSEEGLKRFFESKKQAKLEKMFGSKGMFVIAAVMQKENLKANKRDLEKYFKSHIDLKEHPELSSEDIKARKGESYKDYIDRLGEFVKYTDDEVLNSFINQALKEGISANNIFI